MNSPNNNILHNFCYLTELQHYNLTVYKHLNILLLDYIPKKLLLFNNYKKNKNTSSQRTGQPSTHVPDDSTPGII
jgi:hypothetical protein